MEELSLRDRHAIHNDNIYKINLLLYDANRCKLVAEKCGPAAKLDALLKAIPQLERELRAWEELKAGLPVLEETEPTPNPEA